MVTVDPTNANIVYVGGVNIWKSTDGGVNWTLSTFWYGIGGVAKYLGQFVVKANAQHEKKDE